MKNRKKMVYYTLKTSVVLPKFPTERIFFGCNYVASDSEHTQRNASNSAYQNYKKYKDR